MTREEIILKGRPNAGCLEFELYSQAFNKSMIQIIYMPTINWKTGEKEQNYDKIITEYVKDCINSFINLDKYQFINKLKDEIFRLFNIYIDATDYGQVPDDLINKHGNTEANRIFFNGQSRETVFSTCDFCEVFYEQNTGPELRFTITAKVDWEIEHGLTIFFENGLFVNIE